MSGHSIGRGVPDPRRQRAGAVVPSAGRNRRACSENCAAPNSLARGDADRRHRPMTITTGRSGQRCLISPSNCRPSIPGMLISERTAISAGSMSPDSRSSAASPECAKCIHIDALAGLAPKALPEQFGDIGFVVDHQDADTHDAASVIAGRRERGSRTVNSVNSPMPAVDLDHAAMLQGDDVVADRQAEPGALASRLGREKRLEQLVADFRRNAGAVVAHADFNRVAETVGRYFEGRLEIRIAALPLALVGGVEAVAEQVEKDLGSSPAAPARSARAPGQTRAPA